jgi:hypothetical protein
MKKYIVILITIIPILGFGQVTYEKLPQPFGNSTDYSLFRVNCNSVYTSALNKDRASVGGSPVVNAAVLNDYAYQRAIKYAEKIVNNPEAYFGDDIDGIFHYRDSFGNLYGRAHDDFSEISENGTKFKSENFAPSAEFVLAYQGNLSDMKSDFLLENRMSNLGRRITWAEYISNEWITDLYQDCPAHLANRRNSSTTYKGEKIGYAKYNWKKYGYAIIMVNVKVKHPYYEGLMITKSTIVSYELFSE